MKAFVKIILTILPLPLFAQEAKDLAHIAYLYPAGIERGTRANILIGGRNFENVKEIVGEATFDNVKEIIISGEGVKARIVNRIIPAERSRAVGKINELQKILINRGLLDKTNVSDKKAQQSIDFSRQPDLQLKRQEIIQEQRLFRLMKSTHSSLAETLEVEIQVDKDAKLGKRTLKILTHAGVSNSMPFYIGSLPEYAEYSIREKNFAIIRGANGTIPAEVLSQEASELNVRKAPLIQEVAPPLVINGQIDLFETDIYKFSAKKGENFVAHVQVRELIAFISDAVPAWLQATVSIKNSAGKEIAYQDDFFQNTDPLLAFEIPEDGNYTLEIKDAIFRGREDFVYRITLGAVPFISRIYPLAGKANSPQKVELSGYNLSLKEIELSPDLGTKNLYISKENIFGSKLLYKADEFEHIDNAKAENLSADKAMYIGEKQSVNSILQKNGKHFYKIFKENEQNLSVEIFARRLGSPLDSNLEIFDKDLNLIYSNDDTLDPKDALNTHHSDSKINFRAKAKSTYYIAVSDTQCKFGKDYAYNLSISKLKTDFEVKASPSTINIAEGKSCAFNLSVFRENDFEFPVKIRLKNAPKGLSLSGGDIGASTENTSMVLSCDKNLKVGLYDIELEAVAIINGKERIKKVIACEDMLQAFYYQHLVATEKLQVYVIAMDALYKYQQAYRIQANKNSENYVPEHFDIALGGENTIYIGSYALAYQREGFALEAQLKDSSNGISISKVENTHEGCFVTFKSDANICKSGQSGNLIIDIYTKKKEQKNEYIQKARSGRNDTKLKIDTLRAISYKVL